MARTSFRDRFFTPGTARAIMSPLNILLFGAATAGSILLGVPIAAAALVGAGVYGAKVLTGMPKGIGAVSGPQSRVDPFTLSEPWRSYVQSAQTAKLRFDRTVAGTRGGPIKERLMELSSRLDEGILESWKIATRGHEIDRAIGQLDTTEALTDLAQLRAEARHGQLSADAEATMRSLESQVASAQRMESVSSSTRERLRLLDARFDELVARAVEVSVGAGDSGVLGDDVENLVSELEGLRLAIEDTNRADRGDTSNVDLPGLNPQATPQPAPEPRAQTWPPQ